MVRTNALGGRLAVGMTGVLLFVPLYLQAAAWNAGFGQRGWLASLEPFSNLVLEGWPAAIWIHGIAAVPWVVLIVGLGLRQVEPELEEEALLDSRLPGVLWHVTLPRALPSLAVATLWVFIVCAGEITVTDLYQVRTYAEEVYVTAPLLDLSNDASTEASIRLPNGYLVLGLLLVAAIAVAGQLAPPAESTSMRPQQRFRLPVAPAIAIPVWAIAGVILALVPILNLGHKAGLVVEAQNGGWYRHWSLWKFVVTVGEAIPRYSSEFLWSLLISATTATLAMVLGVVLAWWARPGKLRALPALGLASFCLALPSPVAGLGIIWLFNQGILVRWPGLYSHTILAPVLAQLVVVLPLAILVSWYSLRSIPDDVLEMAKIDGAGSWTRLFSIVLPQRALALAAVWLIGFAVSFADLSASVLVAPPGVTTLPVRIFGLLHAGVDDQVAGIGLNLLAGGALIATVIVWLLARASRSSR
jgi:iron(III) transport system permease protein